MFLEAEGGTVSFGERSGRVSVDDEAVGWVEIVNALWDAGCIRSRSDLSRGRDIL